MSPNKIDCHEKYKKAIDKLLVMIYNKYVTLSRVVEETGPVKPGNLTAYADKVLIPAVYPKDEE